MTTPSQRQRESAPQPRKDVVAATAAAAPAPPNVFATATVPVAVASTFKNDINASLDRYKRKCAELEQIHVREKERKEAIKLELAAQKRKEIQGEHRWITDSTSEAVTRAAKKKEEIVEACEQKMLDFSLTTPRRGLAEDDPIRSMHTILDRGLEDMVAAVEKDLRTAEQALVVRHREKIEETRTDALLVQSDDSGSKSGAEKGDGISSLRESHTQLMQALEAMRATMAENHAAEKKEREEMRKTMDFIRQMVERNGGDPSKAWSGEESLAVDSEKNSGRVKTRLMAHECIPPIEDALTATNEDRVGTATPIIAELDRRIADLDSRMAQHKAEMDIMIKDAKLEILEKRAAATDAIALHAQSTGNRTPKLATDSDISSMHRNVGVDLSVDTGPAGNDPDVDSKQQPVTADALIDLNELSDRLKPQPRLRGPFMPDPSLPTIPIARPRLDQMTHFQAIQRIHEWSCERYPGAPPEPSLPLFALTDHEGTPLHHGDRPLYAGHSALYAGHPAPFPNSDLISCSPTCTVKASYGVARNSDCISDDSSAQADSPRSACSTTLSEMDLQLAALRVQCQD